MDNLDYIESYFTNKQDAEKVRTFENKIQADQAFAEDVAFYLISFQTAKENTQEEKKSQFRELYQLTHYPNDKIRDISYGRRLIYYFAAAAITTGIIFGIYTMSRPVSPQFLADHYIRERLQTLGVTMSGKTDSIQTGLRLYNDERDAEALTQFENIIRSDSSNFMAKKYAGLSALQLNKYNIALTWFEQLATYYKLYSNPGQFYMAITLMERNGEGDMARAKILLQQIVQNNLEGKDVAKSWLEKIN